MSGPTKERKKKFLESLSDFLSDADDLSQDDVVEALEEEGIDVSNLERRTSKIVERESAKRRLAWREHAREERLRIKKLLVSEGISIQGSDLFDKLKEILSGGFGQEALSYAETYFRKRESLSESDIKGLIEDMQHLDLLEEGEKDKD